MISVGNSDWFQSGVDLFFCQGPARDPRIAFRAMGIEGYDRHCGGFIDGNAARIAWLHDEIQTVAIVVGSQELATTECRMECNFNDFRIRCLYPSSMAVTACAKDAGTTEEERSIRPVPIHSGSSLIGSDGRGDCDRGERLVVGGSAERRIGGDRVEGWGAMGLLGGELSGAGRIESSAGGREGVGLGVGLDGIVDVAMKDC